MAEFRLFRWRGLVVVALFVCGAKLAVAQQDSQAPARQKMGTNETVIRQTVRRVVVDVVVTGPHDEPVRGLTKADFAVKEDGTAQTIRTFDVHELNAAPEFVPPKVPPMGPNTFLNLPKEPERGPLNLILYDMANMDTEDQPYARKQLLAFINTKPAGTRFAIVVLSDGMHLVQGFTEDKDKLLAVLDPKRNGPHVPKIFLYGRNYGNGDGMVSASEFTELAHYLEGFSGRKNVIWFSGKFPLSLFANTDNQIIGDGEFTAKVKDLVDTLARDQIAIYPVDVKGAIVTEVFGPPGSSGGDAAVTTDARGTSINSSAAIGGSSASGASASSHASTGQGASQTASQYMAEDGLAEATGGHAYYSTNGLTTALEKATKNGANYYTLSYSPTNGTYNGKLRAISVEMAKKGYKLAYRRSYFGVDHDVRPQAGSAPTMELAGSQGSIPPDDPLSTEMRHGGPMAHDLIFRAQFHVVGLPTLATEQQMSDLVQDAGSLRRRKANKPVKLAKPIPLQAYTVDYRVLDMQTKGAGSRPVTTMEFVAAAFDVDGNMLSGVLQNAVRDEAGSQPAVKQAAFFSVEQRLEVPLKAAWIRVAVRDLSTGRVGTLEVALPLVPETNSATAAPAGIGKP